MVELLSKSRRKKAALPKDTEDHLKHLETFVMELMSPWVAPGTGDRCDDFEELSDILKEAVELSHYLRRQRPCWSVRFPRMPIQSYEEIILGRTISHVYDTETMRDCQFDDVKTGFGELRKLMAECVLAPGLYKRGRLEGDHFDEESIVKKVEVVVWTKDSS
jgi:hypothetical protein